MKSNIMKTEVACHDFKDPLEEILQGIHKEEEERIPDPPEDVK